MTPMSKRVFVFGANEAGKHGAGAALYARLHHGAVYGVGVGLTGNSYALPTKDMNIRVLPLESIQVYVTRFLTFAENSPEMEFDVTRIGCGHAGYRDEDIAPLFLIHGPVPANCWFPEAWWPWLGDAANYNDFV